MLLDIVATKEQIEYTRNLLKKVNFGNRGDGTKKYNNGNEEEQFVGILGQVIMCDYFGKPRPNGNQKDRGDNGVDFIIEGIRIDVKTMGRRCSVKPYFSNNLHGEQTGPYYQNDVYLLCSLNKKINVLTICGWTTKEEFLKEEHFRPKGSILKNPVKDLEVTSDKGMYEIYNYELNPFRGKKDFYAEMANLRKKKYSDMEYVELRTIPGKRMAL
jgi:hypothetical protein